jgi:hypothetical protein
MNNQMNFVNYKSMENPVFMQKSYYYSKILHFFENTLLHLCHSATKILHPN